jgi:hypothetical protein
MISRLTIHCAIGGVLAAACGDDPATVIQPEPSSGEAALGGAPGAGRYAVIANLESSAFLGIWDAAKPGGYDNREAFEVASYSYVFARGRDLIVAQNLNSDEVLRFEHGADGGLSRGGSFSAPAQSVPMDVVFAGPDKAYVSLLFGGQVLAFDPRTMERRGEIDLTGPELAVAEPGSGDLNPEPGALGIRGGELYVGLAQKKNTILSHSGMYMGVVDIASDTLRTSFSDQRANLAQSGGEIDRVYLDERGDLYVYGGGSYGFDPEQSHGFLRIRGGQAEFDRSYLFNLNELSFDVPGGRIDYLNHLTYAGNGLVYAAGNVPSLVSNPPDYVNDFSFRLVELNLYEQTARVLPLPPSNGYSGAVAIEGDRLLAALAAREGVGIYTYDLVTNLASSAPVVTTQGYVSQLVRLNDE